MSVARSQMARGVHLSEAMTIRPHFTLGLIGLMACQGPGTNTQSAPDVSSISSDNGSWGNGSWGNGSWGNGSWGNGSWGNGTWGNGSWGNGTWGNGSWGNGTWGNGTWGNGSWGNGTWGNGTWGNGTWGNGTWGNGSWGNGSWGNGSWGNGMLFGNLAVSSLDISNLSDTVLAGDACTATPNPSEAMTELMVYVAAIQCALPAPCAENDTACMDAIDCANDPDCRVVTDCEGNELYVAGKEGLGTNQGDPATVAAVDSCIDATLASLNADFRAYADNLNRYSASCALPESSGGTCGTDPGCVEVTYQLYPSGTETIQYYGGIGLAPSWKTNSDFDADPVGQRRVSACLASRTNPHRKTVQLSVRGMGIPTTATERRTYTHHEGAFWGNMFEADPVVHSCSVKGDGPSGRICTGGQCSFVDEGPCALVCLDQDSEGNYTNCGSEGSTDVINIFLPLQSNISTGTHHMCANLVNGSSFCWGNGTSGQIGDGGVSTVPVGAAPVDLDNVQQIVASHKNTCARHTDGSVSCWGRNNYGQVGNGSTSSSQLVPTAVLGDVGSDISQIASGKEHACATRTDGQVFCWGRNSYGNLGNGTTTSSTLPVEVLNLTGAIKTQAGSGFSCSLTNDGNVWCWGKNYQGRLGIGSTVNQSLPAQVGLASPAIDISITYGHTCALLDDGRVFCWGSGSYGRLGNGSTAYQTSPAEVTGLPLPAKAITAGFYTTCAVLDDDSLWCWGLNSQGQVGDGTTVNRSSPVQAMDGGVPMTGVQNALAGGNHACAQKTDGSVWCWGHNAYGQLGLGYTSAPVISPERVTILDNCGDGVCEFSESSTYCPSDCSP